VVEVVSVAMEANAHRFVGYRESPLKSTGVDAGISASSGYGMGARRNLTREEAKE
jgi:hypothetical protein